MDLKNAQVTFFKKPFQPNSSLRTTINPKTDLEANKNTPSTISKTPKNKSISMAQIKSIQSFSTSALPHYNQTEQVNNCEAGITTPTKNNKISDAVINEVSADSFSKKMKTEHIRQYHTPKFKKDNQASHTEITVHNKSSTQLNVLNLRQTTYGNSMTFIPKHKHPEWLQKMEAYSKALKSPKINAVEKKNEMQKEEQSKLLNFQQVPEIIDRDSKEFKLFFRQTLDPQMDRNLIDNGIKNLTPSHFKKKVSDKEQKDLSANKIDKAHKYESKNCSHQILPQSGSFWKNKAVSPPSKAWSPLKNDPNTSKQIKVPLLPLHTQQKTLHKPSFFMNKKSLNRFSIMKQLGSGTISDAFLCMDKKSNALFCLKRYHKATMKSLPEVLDNFIRKIAFQLLAEDPNIVQLYDIFCDGEFIFTIEQYMQGGRLSQNIQRQIQQRQQKRRQTQNLALTSKEPDEPLFNQSRIIDKIYDINSALCYIHQSYETTAKSSKKRLPPIAHGDVRTKSILVCMGVCKLPSIEPANTKPHYINSYSPPQQIIQQVYIPKSDIWNVGLILFQLCAQRKLFGHSDSSLTNDEEDTKPGYQVFNVNITQEIDKLVGTTQLLKELMKKLLAIQPEDRPTSSKVMESNVFRMYGFDVEWKERRNEKFMKAKDMKVIGGDKQQSEENNTPVAQPKTQSLGSGMGSNRQSFSKRETEFVKTKQLKTKNGFNSHNSSFNLNVSKDLNLSHTHEPTDPQIVPNFTKPHWTNKSRVSLERKN